MARHLSRTFLSKEYAKAKDVGNRLAAHINSLLGSISSLAFREGNRILAQDHVFSDVVDPGHGLALGAEQGEVDQDRVLLDSCSGLSLADRVDELELLLRLIWHDSFPSFIRFCIVCLALG